MSLLTDLYQSYQELIKTNPVFAGLASMYLLTVVGFFLRSVPSRIATFLWEQSTTDLTFNNAGYGTNLLQFRAFMEWYASTRWAKFSRNLAMDGGDWSQDKMVIGPGYGVHFFRFNGKWFWFRKTKLESSGTAQEKEAIIIRCFGRNQQVIIDLIDSFRHKPSARELSVYARTREATWVQLAVIQKRPLDTVILDKTIKTRLVEQLTYFRDNAQWYHDRGMPHKLTYVLEGPPGTGKTSLVRALGSYFERDIFLLSLSGVTDAQFEQAVASVPRGSFVLIEDFDSSGAVKRRAPPPSPLISLEPPAPGKQTTLELASTLVNQDTPDGKEEFSLLTLSGVLNTLDGIVSLDDTVIFMTTNHLEKIDPALIRKGRVDHIVHIGLLGNAEISEYVQLMYPGVSFPETLNLMPMAGCDLQAMFLEHRENHQAFMTDLIHRQLHLVQHQVAS